MRPLVGQDQFALLLELCDILLGAFDVTPPPSVSIGREPVVCVLLVLIAIAAPSSRSPGSPRHLNKPSCRETLPSLFCVLASHVSLSSRCRPRSYRYPHPRCHTARPIHLRCRT